jgi:putative hydrolase of the HAD superfamily
MKKTSGITCVFVDIGGVLLTNGWDHHARRRAVAKFKLDWAEMEERHRLVFEIHEEGKLTFEEYLSLVVFYEKRPFTRAQFRRFMCEQSKPYPDMIAMLVQLKARGLKIAVVGLGIRSILHTDYESTRAQLAALGLTERDQNEYSGTDKHRESAGRERQGSAGNG